MTEKRSPKALTVHCPACGVGPGEPCKLDTDKQRNTPHKERRILAPDHEFLELIWNVFE